MAMLDAVLAGRNSFNLVRLTAASAVVVSHSYAVIKGELLSEPLYGLTPYTLGQHGYGSSGPLWLSNGGRHGLGSLHLLARCLKANPYR